MTSPALSQAQQALANAVNNVLGFANGFVAADIAAALALAKSTNDAAGQAAWIEIQTTISSILPTSIPQGAGIAYFIQVARGFAINQAAFNAAVGQVFPQLVTAYNLAVSQLYTLTAAGAVVPVPSTLPIPPVAP